MTKFKTNGWRNVVIAISGELKILASFTPWIDRKISGINWKANVPTSMVLIQKN